MNLEKSLEEAVQLKEQIYEARKCISNYKLKEGDLEQRRATAEGFLLILANDLYGMINEMEKEFNAEKDSK